MIDVIICTLLVNKNAIFVSSSSNDVSVEDFIVCNIDGGLYIAKVLKANYKVKSRDLTTELYKMERVATEEDIKKHSDNLKKASDALIESKKIAKSLNLEMSFVDSYFNLDKSQLFLSCVSETRIDFRELAKKIAQKYRTRVELRQIGVRDKAKKVGGLGPCGLFLCCNTFLTDFDSVSINMAKNQMLALNPSKINGVCGRLLCCLGYENDVYSELRKKLPKIGSSYEAKIGTGKVVSIDLIQQTFSVDFGENGIVEFSGDEYSGSTK